MDKPEVPQDKIINKINSSINNESYDNPFPCYKEGNQYRAGHPNSLI